MVPVPAVACRPHRFKEIAVCHHLPGAMDFRIGVLSVVAIPHWELLGCWTLRDQILLTLQIGLKYWQSWHRGQLSEHDRN
jgi:hypothetical protein